MLYEAPAGYMNGFLDGIIKMALSSCRNEDGYEMSAVLLSNGKESFIKAFSAELGCDEQELVICEKSFLEICRERLGKDRKSRRAILELEDMLVSEFGEEENLYVFKNDRDIRDAYSGYSGGDAPYYIVSQLFIIEFENAAIMFIIGSDE